MKSKPNTTIRLMLSLFVGMAICLPAVAGTGKPAGDGVRVTTRAANSASPARTDDAAVPPAAAIGADVEMVGSKHAVRGELLIAFRPGVGRGRADAVRSELGAVEVKELRQIGVRVWRLPPGLTVAKAVGILNNNPDVRFAEPNLVMTMLTTGDSAEPQDPSFINPPGWPFGWQEHLRHDDASAREIHAEEAWAGSFFGQGVVVAVVDTGVDLNHPDLAHNLYRDGSNTVIGGNFVLNRALAATGRDARSMAKGGVTGKPKPSSTSPDDDHGHGTHVAGLIAAEMNNLADALLETPESTAAWQGGVVGVAPQARIMPVKVLNGSGNGASDGIAEGILFAADHGAQIINLSLGGGFSQTMSDALNYAWVTKDVLVIAAAGNSASESPQFPASDLHALSVAAVDSADRCASFSNRGWWVDVAAPGVAVLSSLIDGNGPYNGGYGRMSGTSMASPVTAGVAALIRAAHPEWTAEQAAAQLLASVENIDADNPGLEGKLGTGRVNAFAAVNAVAAPIATVQGLGAPGGTLNAVGPGDEIWVQFSHPVAPANVLGIGNYHLRQGGTPITLEMASTEYEPFPGQGVRLRLLQELPADAYEFQIDPAVIPGGHVHSFTIVPAPIVELRQVLPLGSLAYRASTEGKFRPVNALGLGSESEPNDTLGDADPLPGWYEVSPGVYRTVLSGTIDPPTDADYFEFQAAAGDVITVAMQALDPLGRLDCYLELRDAGDTVLARNDDNLDDSLFNGSMDSRIAEFAVPAAGTYYIRAISWNGGSSGPYKLVADLTTASSPPPPASIPEPAVAMFSLDLDADQTVTTQVRVGTPATVQLFHYGAEGAVDVTPAEDHDPGLGVLYQSVGPLDEGTVLVCIQPRDPFSIAEYSLEVLLNAALEEVGDNDAPLQAQSLDSSFQQLHGNTPESYRTTIAGNLFDWPRVYVETPGTTGDLNGCWDRVGANTWAINAAGNPHADLNRGVTGVLTADKRTVQYDYWQVDLKQGDLFSLKPWGVEEGGGTASGLSVRAEIYLGQGWYQIFSGSELNNIRVPATSRCIIAVRCANSRSTGTYTLTAELVSDSELQVDTADYYAFSLTPGTSVDLAADPRVQVEQFQDGDQCIVKVTPRTLGHIDYGVALTLNTAFDQAEGNEAREQAQLLAFAALGHVGGGVVGYFTEGNEGTHAADRMIRRAGLAPLPIADIASCDLSAIRILLLHMPNEPPSSALLQRMPYIEAWVRGGGTLVIHDRRVSSAEGVAGASPLLVGAPATMVELNFEFGTDLNVIRNDTLVTDGPGGTIDHATLDGGYYSNHGFAHAGTLPALAVPILSAGPDPDRVAAFAYPLDAGHVYYSTIPLDFYLDYYLEGGDADPLIRNFCDIYAPNVVAYAKSLGGTDREDWYTFGWLEAGALISLESRTPADGLGQFENLLDPGIALFRPDGGAGLVQADSASMVLPDGRNEAVRHTVTADEIGTYYLRVIAEGDVPGEYAIVPSPEEP